SHVAAGALIAADEVAPAHEAPDVRIVVVALLDHVPGAREQRETIPFPAALRVHPGPAAVLELIEPVRLMHQAQVDELQAVALVAGAEREDGLGLVVRLADRTRVAVIQDLPGHLLRMPEPQAHAVDAEMAEGAGDARALEGLARDELGLEARLELELVAHQIAQRGAAGRRA